MKQFAASAGGKMFFTPDIIKIRKQGLRFLVIIRYIMQEKEDVATDRFRIQLSALCHNLLGSGNGVDIDRLLFVAGVYGRCDV